MSKDIPTITSIFVSSYLQTYVDWDMDKEAYVSVSDKSKRKEKLQEIEWMVMDADMTKEEYEFLLSTEKDTEVSKAIKKGRTMIKKVHHDENELKTE